MTIQNSVWQLEITPKGEIFVTHFGKPRFKVEFIPKNDESEVEFLFNGEWEDHPDCAMNWYLKALEFYRFAIKQPEFHRSGVTLGAVRNQSLNNRDNLITQSV
jgi:hypothetical protein